MKNIPIAVLVVLSATGGLAWADTAPVAAAMVEGRSGSQARGSVIFTPAGDKIRVGVRISGLTPGEHGFHIHEAGDCSAPDAMSAKGHFNPAGRAHGHVTAAEHHAGDLPNLVADADGNARASTEVSGFTLDDGPTGILGRAVVIHADPDDYKTQPAGNSGKRVACGVIKAH